MIRHLTPIVLTLVGTAFTAFTVSAAPVEIRISNLHQATGEIQINLFKSPQSWDKEKADAVLQLTPENAKSARAKIDLPIGTYAFFLFHDEDGNGELKRKAFGLPGEPYAFSNNVQIGFSKPAFEKMKFSVTESGAVQEIVLVRP